MANLSDFTGYTSINLTSQLANSRQVLARSTSALNAVAATSSYIRLASGSANVTINGIVGGVDGLKLTIYNAGTGTLTIGNLSTAAAAANRIATLQTAALATVAAGAISMLYDGVASRWVVINNHA